ncbi:MAG: type II toxin-antitoxin system VapC family toxin [Sphingomonas sp.]|jgi:tRNA(fMet)-specific endonuclease VapC|uniref:type II toxin-antitoxin system VapC family toxin n=1 Tax=Sphingomonas sp. CD22 TaxID=3100214 RepID=UPI001202F2B0|nr:type II toxin-antitoxin system VapC family toxin [Sphingomonas sp. CD22]MEA1082741.1 type II toxin-antitoxin system VapC family toxin [Sphingomonas sp. CD22]RZM32890.1 MAG: type II toxin-antitoxin system VapC family toxin [Sphingomonas sp.]
MYLLDTNVCIDFAKARSDVLRARIRAKNGQGMSLSAITLAELRYGAARPEADPSDEARLDIFVSVLAVHDFGRAAAESYARLAGTMPFQRHSFDRLIAAHALALDLTLVTNNTRHFVDIPGLRVENWTR